MRSRRHLLVLFGKFTSDLFKKLELHFAISLIFKNWQSLNYGESSHLKRILANVKQEDLPKLAKLLRIQSKASVSIT
ncbi:hypothetical protein L596_016777 [Steinernema carpocapsae]|uniref:Uncharacterized protein n=1 Tax=Steinernema carpocapsae TaxID=34508 RepID=A0A4U5NK65_STECR|nr:hypothetical protein L596_016777 [Steinernema carpocapsae]